MVETDWRKILNFTHKELNDGDKETLCESLSWMEADDIELNFSDLKTLFRLAQDILKYKNEQVNNLLGKIESLQKKTRKKSKTSAEDSPARSSDDVLETIAHQEELIKANKDILEQLYTDIAELENKKKGMVQNSESTDKESESSRDPLSEMNAITQLENEVSMKNKHIGKLLFDVKVLEDENTQFKEKISTIKEKLSEATQVIENLTEQLFALNNECSKLKETLGKTEEEKSKMSVERKSMEKQLREKESDQQRIYEGILAKVQHWKNVAKTKKSENENLARENENLKSELYRATQILTSPKASVHNDRNTELQNKLVEATNEILKSANIIEQLKIENKKNKQQLEAFQDETMTESRNESDENKEIILIKKLKKKITELNINLKNTEDTLIDKEKELANTKVQLQLLKSGDEGIAVILNDLKSKKRLIRQQEEEIKSFVKEINKLNKTFDHLQVQNESMRQKLNITNETKVPTRGILRKMHDNEQQVNIMSKEIQRMENKLITLEIEKRNLNRFILKLKESLELTGFDITNLIENSDDEHAIPTNGQGDGPKSVSMIKTSEILVENNTETQALIEENEGLRKGLQEILVFLKDNSTTSSGILALECPALETVLQSMEARHATGWTAPHMAAILELKSVIGGRDTLLKALHEAKKETFDVMKQLSNESKKCQELEQKLFETENNTKIVEESAKESGVFSDGEFGTWMSEKELGEIDFYDKSQIEDIIVKGNMTYENQLKNGLTYFHSKFKSLFDKMTTVSIQATDEQNKLLIENENMKAEIENLKSQLNDDDSSDDSPGLLNNSQSTVSLQRKCDYLSEAYKNIRTRNENIRNELLECRKEGLINTAKYETQIQKFILSIASLTDKLRNSISIELFYKQNDLLNSLIIKHRTLVQDKTKKILPTTNLMDTLHKDKLEMISKFQQFNDSTMSNKNMLMNVEMNVLHKQIESLCKEVEDKNLLLVKMEATNKELQENQLQLIDKNISNVTQEEYNLIKADLEKISHENASLKDQCQHVTNQLDIALLQLNDNQHRQMSTDLEINMLRHQILDLQSASDNKAIVARLSSDILLAHLHATENHNKIEKLNLNLQRERQKTSEAEELLNAREKIFNVYLQRCESKYRYLYEVVQVLRYQYQGSLPLDSIEDYLKTFEDISKKNIAVDAKLNEIEDLQSKLLAKSVVLDQVLDEFKDTCLDDEDNCPHKIKYVIMQNMNAREMSHLMKKIQTLEKSRTDLVNQCSSLERALVMVNQGFEKSPSFDEPMQRKHSEMAGIPNLELEDVLSEDESISRKSQTITLPKPQILKAPNSFNDMTKKDEEKYLDQLPGSPVRLQPITDKNKITTVDVLVQTSKVISHRYDKTTQTDLNFKWDENEQTLKKLRTEYDSIIEENRSVTSMLNQKKQELNLVNKENDIIKQQKQVLLEQLNRANAEISNLKINVEALKEQLTKTKQTKTIKGKQSIDQNYEESNTLLKALKKLESDKNTIVEEFQTLLASEREDFTRTVDDLQNKLRALESRPMSHVDDSKETQNNVVKKYTLKIVELEDKCFKLQSEMDNCKTDLKAYQNEADRWKELASERLTKMEQLSSQLEVRHCSEVDSYKAENQHWLTQLNEAQREHADLRNKLSEQKSAHIKQLADKDSHIEQLRTIVHNLKTQIMNMQTMMSVNDPSFDLSAIVEVDTDSEGAVSHRESDNLEIRFDSSNNLQNDPIIKLASSTSTLWQEPLIERLRREKLLISKQNGILRRQIKVLAARERRARLETQNLKNQIYRISTSGNKLASAESMSLQSKIASLTSQLQSAKRDSQSSVALWDKWKRSQHAAERWQTRFEEKCREIKKVEINLNLAKSSLARLEKEKRVLLTKLTECEERQLPLEKQEHEHPEKLQRDDCSDLDINIRVPPHITTQSLMDRIEAQQRRIAALELADKGNEPLVTEYEKVLAENTVLKGQVLKLESTLLEFQIKSPLKSKEDKEPELEYWKSYCDMLKEENMQLTMKLGSVEVAPYTSNQQRINDLEQTILTLRSLVSKLQVENKSSITHKRVESKFSNPWNSVDKKLETYRIEIANLKRTIVDKDNLLERSKEMLKIAAEREDELLRENAALHQRLNELLRSSGGFNSV